MVLIGNRKDILELDELSDDCHLLEAAKIMERK